MTGEFLPAAEQSVEIMKFLKDWAGTLICVGVPVGVAIMYSLPYIVTKKVENSGYSCLRANSRQFNNK